MSTISTGYNNAFSSPAAVTSSPANFGPGQIKTDDEQTEGNQSRAREANENEKSANAGFTTPTRGNLVNITA